MSKGGAPIGPASIRRARLRRAPNSFRLASLHRPKPAAKGRAFGPTSNFAERAPTSAPDERSSGGCFSPRGRHAESLDAFKAEASLRGPHGAASIELSRAHQAAARTYGAAGDSKNATRSYERAEDTLRKFEKLVRAEPARTSRTLLLKDTSRTKSLAGLKALLAEFVDFLQQTGQSKEAGKVQTRLDEIEK